MSKDLTPATPTRLDALAHELEGMAARATHADHSASPIIDAIEREASVRPFAGALQTMVTTMAAASDSTPRDSIVVRLIRESDLEPTQKLQMLREFALAERHWGFRWYRPEEARAALNGPGLQSSLFVVAREGGRAALDVLAGWAMETPRGVMGEVPPGDMGACLLLALAERSPASVLDALAPPASTAMSVVARLATAHPTEAVAFVRRCLAARQYAAAVYAVAALATLPTPPTELRELATAIAGNPETDGARSYALIALVRLRPVAPEIWSMMPGLPDRALFGVARALGAEIRAGLREPLEVLEGWLCDPASGTWLIDECCEAFAEGLDARLPRQLDADKERRLVRDLLEAKQRGASEHVLARAAEVAIHCRSDSDFASLGLHALVDAVAAAGPMGRTLLLYALSEPDFRDVSWKDHLLERIALRSACSERLGHAKQLTRTVSAPDAWTEAHVDRLLTSCLPEIHVEAAALACHDTVPGDGDREGVRQIVAWFARAFPQDVSIARALRRVTDGPDLGVRSDVLRILYARVASA